MVSEKRLCHAHPSPYPPLAGIRANPFHPYKGALSKEKEDSYPLHSPLLTLCPLVKELQGIR